MSELFALEERRRTAAVGGGRRGRWAVVGLLGAVLVTAAACSSGSTATSTTTGANSASGSGAGGSTTSNGSSSVVDVAHVGSTGLVLVDHAGRTLYRYTPDGTGKSTCNGGCATAWPPLTVAAGTMKVSGASPISGSLGTISRSDGTLQVTYKGMPLYTFTGDVAAGQDKGQGAGGIWFVIPVTSNSAPSGTSASTTTSTVGSGSGY